MSLFYKLQYLLGLTPWERMSSLPIGEQAIALLEKVEFHRELPYGHALDLGCGTGFWSVHLAQRGWEVTGVDIVSKAVRTARDRSRKAGVEIRFVKGSVSALTEIGIGSGYSLILDFGTVHGLPPDQVQAVGREVTAVATENSTIMMYAFSPGRRGPLPRGISREEIKEAYSEWSITKEEAFQLTGVPRVVQKAAPRFYCLRRK
jgi:SAM-dependent methyltransferase